MTTTSTSAPVLQWETDVRLMTHPIMLGNFAKVILISGFIIAALLSLLFIVNGEADELLPILEMMSMILVGLAVLMALVSLIFFGNKMRMRFHVDGKGADVDVIDRRANAANKVAIIAGVLAGKPAVTGAGLMADSNKHQHIAWNAVAKARYHPNWGCVSLANSWRTMLVLYCTADNYSAVAAAVEGALQARPAEAKKAKKNPLPMLLVRTLLTIVACVPLFVMPDLDEHALLPALLTLAFALSALWLIPHLGLVIFATIGWEIILEVAEQGCVRTSMFDNSTFTGWSVMSGDEQAGFVFAGAGVAYLAWQTIGLIRGKIRSGLLDDMVEAEEG